MNRLAAALGRFLFPPKCMFCRQVIKEGHVCPSCLRKLPERGKAPIKGEFFSKCAAPLAYTGQVRRAVLAMKFGGRRSYAAGFGEMLAPAIERELAGEYDIITWVPLSDRRLRERGYDQARLLAESTGELLGAQVMGTLRKTAHTRPQSGIRGKAQRRANVMGAYTVPEPSLVEGLRVLLIDDVVTTGATFSECARELLMAGAERVVCAAAAGPARTGK